MYKIDDFIIYKKDVCKITDIKKNHLYNEDYYMLGPIGDLSLKIEVPVLNKNGFLKELITKEGLDDLIKKISFIEPLMCNDRMLENEYRRLLKSNTHEDLIKIIKTTYLRNKDRLLNHKKIGEKDNSYFNQAEKFLYTEISVSLKISYDEAKEYIVKMI